MGDRFDVRASRVQLDCESYEMRSSIDGRRRVIADALRSAHALGLEEARRGQEQRELFDGLPLPLEVGRELEHLRTALAEAEAKLAAVTAERDAARSDLCDLLPSLDAHALMITQVGRERDRAESALAEAEAKLAAVDERCRANRQPGCPVETPIALIDRLLMNDGLLRGDLAYMRDQYAQLEKKLAAVTAERDAAERREVAVHGAAYSAADFEAVALIERDEARAELARAIAEKEDAERLRILAVTEMRALERQYTAALGHHPSYYDACKAAEAALARAMEAMPTDRVVTTILRSLAYAYSGTTAPPYKHADAADAATSDEVCAAMDRLDAFFAAQKGGDDA